MVAVATGRIDGYYFFGGLIAGMFVFGEMYPLISNFHISGAQGVTLLSDWLNTSLGVVGILVIILALLMFWGSEWLEKKFAVKETAQ
jgi:hypothetical protein